MTVSIRASLLLSALAMAALTAAFAAPTETSDQAKALTNPTSEVGVLTEKPEPQAEPARESDPCIASIQPASMEVKGAITANAEAPQPLRTSATSSSLGAQLPARCAP